ncbi:MAG TPA: TIR domain-containing protein [Candidatus Sulfotelmatobacter sp.]
MANLEHVAELKKGAEAWNTWRTQHPKITPDFSGATLVGASLSSAILSYANLRGADLSNANLLGAHLNGAALGKANLSHANLAMTNLWRAGLAEAMVLEADLTNAKVCMANLCGARFCNTNFWTASLSRSALADADLTGANLAFVDLSYSDLARTNIDAARIRGTIFGCNDLSEVTGLETVRHEGPSTVGIDTIYLSKGKIPEVFLRGCGVPDEFVAYAKSLVTNPIEFYSCFISYSTQDQAFADRLYADLQNKGVRCWFAPEDLKIGDRFQERIEESIRIYDKLLVLLSERSVNSSWVEREVQAAFEKEQRQGTAALFPVRIDDAVMDCPRAWAADIRRTRHIGDFRKWKDHDSFQKSLNRLLRDLKSQDPSPK